MDLIYKNNGRILPQDKLFTLYDIVIKLDVANIAKFYEFICKQEKLLAKEFLPKDIEAHLSQFEAIKKIFAKVCVESGLNMTRNQMVRVGEVSRRIVEVDDNDLRAHLGEDLRAEVTTLKRFIEAELESKVAFLVATENHIYLENQFPKEVPDQFPDLGFDMDEACNCMLFERHTATCAHLMRICEGGLKYLFVPLDIGWQQTWAHVIGAIGKKALEFATEDMWESKDLKEIGASVRLIKGIWRNEIMHFGRKYDKGEAEKMFGYTNQLIEEIATYINRYKKKYK